MKGSPDRPLAAMLQLMTIVMAGVIVMWQKRDHCLIAATGCVIWCLSRARHRKGPSYQTFEWMGRNDLRGPLGILHPKVSSAGTTWLPACQPIARGLFGPRFTSLFLTRVH